ncbi:ATP-binding protein [Actinoplanes italicus]|uniref:Putative AbiEii toxin of type IV toxin-antitoxin system n=1 Tax=Actinoplanes italicus TaxID=113567 RepID=A0A2T0JY23_9ACTN|nr:putative AbiEii toxin of type IV toxin-antitoxin system [Actinoplanes italicus]GIE33878.1 ATP-binding protein [Actinoplanes italicus]
MAVYIKEIRLEDVRGFRGARRVSLDLTRPDGTLAGWTVVAGRNGSGKTSLLRAMALAVAGPAVARGLVDDFGTWVSAGADFGLSSVWLTPDPEADGFLGDDLPAADIFRIGLGWRLLRPTSPNRTELRPLLRPVYFGDGVDRLAEAGPWSENPAGWFCAAYGPFRRLAGGSGEAHRLMLNTGPAGRMTSLFHEDASLAEGVTWLIEQHLRALEGRPGAAELKQAALAVLGDGLLPDGFRIHDVDSDGLWVRDGNRRFPLREMSDGYRTVAALVVDLLKQLHRTYGRLAVEERDGTTTVTDPGVVLIDEVDAHLHVFWQKRIGVWLKRHFPRIQFIVTTHSPYVCQAADEQGLIRLPAPGEDEPPTVVDQARYERIVYGSGDDAVVSDLFGLDTPYSEEAVRLRRELVSLETDVLAGRAGADAVRRYEQLRHRLSSSPATRAVELAAGLLADAG